MKKLVLAAYHVKYGEALAEIALDLVSVGYKNYTGFSDKIRLMFAGLPIETWVLAANNLFVAIGFGVMMPVLPLFAKQFHVGHFEISWVISSFALMRLVVSPFCGKIAQVLGERLALTLGVAIVAISSAAAGFAQSFWQLLVYRALGGIGSAMFTVAAFSLLLRVTPATKRGRATGVYNAGFLLGGMLGPAMGGLVVGISLSAPFFFYAVTLAMAGVVVAIFVREPKTALESKEKIVGKPIKEVVADIRYQAACLTGFAQGWQSFGVRSSLVPIFVTTVLLKQPEWTGYAFAVSAVAQTLVTPFAGRYTDMLGRRPVMVAGGLISAVGAITLPWAPNIWVLIIILCCYGVGAAFLSTAPAAAVGDAAGPKGSTAVALFSMTTDFGVIIGPLVAGLIADHYGMKLAFLAGGILMAIAALYSLRMPAGVPAAETADVAEIRDRCVAENIEEDKAG